MVELGEIVRRQIIGSWDSSNVHIKDDIFYYPQYKFFVKYNIDGNWNRKQVWCGEKGVYESVYGEGSVMELMLEWLSKYKYIIRGVIE